MGVVRRTKRVLRSAGRLEAPSQKTLFRAARPSVLSRRSVNAQIKHHVRLAYFINNSNSILEKQEGKLIEGKIKPKLVNDSTHGGAYNGGYATASITAVMAGAMGAAPAIGSPIDLSTTMAAITGAAAGFGFSVTRRARVFNVLNKSIILARKDKPLTEKQKQHNADVVREAKLALTSLNEENDRQVGLLRKYSEDLNDY